MTCDAADGGGGNCPSGYTCSGKRSILPPFCAVPGSSISDISSRYDTSTPDPVAPASPIGQPVRICKTPVKLSGTLESGDVHVQRGIKTSGGCALSPATYLYWQDVYALELVGPGPHEIEITSPAPAGVTLALNIFQKPGSSTPFDTSKPCQSLVWTAEDGWLGGGLAGRLIGVQPGTLYVVATSTSPDKTGTYEFQAASTTSECQ
jgi:hypothetical protein